MNANKLAQAILATITICAARPPASADYSGPLTTKVYRSVIPGTWCWNLETSSLCTLNVSHLWWEHQDYTRRRLKPMNGTGLVRVSGRSFESLTLTSLRRLDYGTEPVSGSDVSNDLEPGAVLALRTPAGRYAKLKVVRYYRLHDFTHPAAGVLAENWKEFALTRPNVANYSIELDWVLYPAPP